jgi:cytochrome c oxidase subunit 2
MRRSLAVVTIAASLGLGALASACGSDSGGSPVQLSAAGEKGKTVAKEQGCTSCHTPDGKQSIGPTWQGLAGSTQTLDDGTEVTADDAYLRQSILQPKSQIVKGYPSSMPIYDGELTDAELDALIAYLHDLAPDEDGTATTGG